MTDQTTLPDAEQLAQQLIEQLRPHITANSAFVGIHTGGAWLAQKLHAALATNVPLGTLDISFYRDDFGTMGLHPEVKPSVITFEVEDRDIILVDDVLYSGRTVRAAMNELFDFGRPASIKLVVLVDRGGRELPICADFCGAKVELADNQSIQIGIEDDGKLSMSLHTWEEIEGD
jgi:pyrimidine operon attenuation protein/uracil phosphoribosyltransferase